MSALDDYLLARFDNMKMICFHLLYDYYQCVYVYVLLVA